MYPRAAKDISEIERFINDSMAGLKNNIKLDCVILNKNNKEFLGVAGLANTDKPDPELGVWIKKEAHGNAFGKEAIHGLKKWADENLDYEYLIYPATKENIPSQKIALSLGGIIEREYDEKNMSGNILHFLEYRIYKESTEKSNPAPAEFASSPIPKKAKTPAGQTKIIGIPESHPAIPYMTQFLDKLKEFRTRANEKRTETKIKNLKLIMEFANRTQKVTNDDVERITGIQDSQAQRYLKKLVEDGKLTRFGKTKDIYYAPSK